MFWSLVPFKPAPTTKFSILIRWRNVAWRFAVSAAEGYVCPIEADAVPIALKYNSKKA